MKFRHLFKLKSSSSSSRVYEADGVLMHLDFLEGMTRVALIKNKDSLLNTWSVCPGDCKMPLEGRDKLSLENFKTVSVEVKEKDGVLSFRHCDCDYEIELMNFRITLHKDGKILYQDRSGLAYNFEGELGDGSVHYTARNENQKIFGLGDKCGNVNKNNQRFVLGETDSMGFKAKNSDPLYKHIPFYICENEAGSYGIYYDTYSNGEIDFGKEHDNYFEPFNSIRYEEENMVFYIIHGDNLEIIRKFNSLTGGISDVPEWAFKYCGSTMEYTDAPDADKRLREFIGKCEEYGIDAGGFYLSSGYTQIGDRRCVFHWNRDKIPSPEGLSDYFREKGLEIIPNVKPAFLTEHPLYEYIASKGWFLKYSDGTPACFPFWGGMASYLDFTNPEAFDFWKKCVKENLNEYGYFNIWNDNNEYDVWDRDILACNFGKPVSARLIRPLFSLLMATASRQACEEEKKGILFMVSRCAPAGIQRVATTWTGDNYTDFKELRYNHFQAMTMALSGFCFFGQDIGGFSGPKPGKELFLRWLQYGVFMPRFVLHSWKPGEPSTMPWLYPELMPAVKRIFDLRNRLIPYLHSQMNECVKTGEPLLKPVFLLDKDYDVESDNFFIGDDILACPIFDEGVTEKEIKLPCGNYRLRGEGDIIKGGSSVKIKCHPEDLPVWFEKQ